MVDYSAKSLYDVIKNTLLVKDKDLMRFIIVSNDDILDEYKKIKKNTNITLNEIIKKYENYTIVYMTVRGIMVEANISKHQELSREITNMFLDDELDRKSNDKSKSVYDSDD